MWSRLDSPASLAGLGLGLDLRRVAGDVGDRDREAQALALLDRLHPVEAVLGDADLELRHALVGLQLQLALPRAEGTVRRLRPALEVAAAGEPELLRQLELHLLQPGDARPHLG